MIRTAFVLLLALAGCTEKPTPQRPAPTSATPTAGGKAAHEQEPALQQDPTASPEYRNYRLDTPPIDGLALLGRDAVTGDLGALLISRAPAAGAYAVAARAGVGVAVSFGQTADHVPNALLAELGNGGGAALAVQRYTSGRTDLLQQRVLALIDADGGFGEDTFERARWSSAHGRSDFALRTYDVGGFDLRIDDELAFWQTTADLPLVERLVVMARRIVAATKDLEGTRAPRSAALLVVRAGYGPFGVSDRLVDLRVDWHADPFDQLQALLEIELAAFVTPRLLSAQRLLDQASPVYARNAAWLDRLRKKTPLGAVR